MNDRRFGKLPGEQNSAYRPALKLQDIKRLTTQARSSTPDFDGKALKKMANRKGVFIGAYVPNQLKEALQQRAKAEHRTLSQEITRILEEAIKGKRLPPGTIDRRTETTGPRRRATDPLPRRREGDVPYIPSEHPSGDD